MSIKTIVVGTSRKSVWTMVDILHSHIQYSLTDSMSEEYRSDIFMAMTTGYVAVCIQQNMVNIIC